MLSIGRLIYVHPDIVECEKYRHRHLTKALQSRFQFDGVISEHVVEEAWVPRSRYRSALMDV